MLESVVEESDDSSVVDSEAGDMVVDVVAVIHVKMVNKTKTKNNTKAMMNMEMEDHAVVVEVFVDAEVLRRAMVGLGAVVDAVVSVAPDRIMKMAKRRMVSKEMALLGEVAEDAVVVEAEDLAVVVADVAVETMAVMTNESFETKKILFTYLTPTFVIC
jgi:hypothetical protein